MLLKPLGCFHIFSCCLVRCHGNNVMLDTGQCHVVSGWSSMTVKSDYFFWLSNKPSLLLVQTPSLC